MVTVLTLMMGCSGADIVHQVIQLQCCGVEVVIIGNCIDPVFYPFIDDIDVPVPCDPIEPRTVRGVYYLGNYY